MIKNISTEQKTLKLQYLNFLNDNYSDLSTNMYCLYKDTILPYKNILNDYFDYFEQYLEDYELDRKYHYQPAAFANMYYGDPGLDFIVMYFAGITTLYDFDRKKIKVLPLKYMDILNKVIVHHKDSIRENRTSPDQI